MPNAFPFADLLPAVRDAGLAEFRFFQNGYEVRVKDDGTPVSSADLAANGILLEALHRLYPGIPVVSEEDAMPPRSALRDRFFLVDPLDGTSDFIAGRTEFTVNVALVENGEVELGIVSAPALGELFVGYRGEALKTDLRDDRLERGVPLRLLDRYRPFEPGRRPRVLVSVSHPDQATAGHLRFIGGVELPVGSSLKFLRIADGYGEYYPRKKELHEWDIAAGHGVLKAAGGNVYRFGTDGEVGYGAPGFVSPPFEAY